MIKRIWVTCLCIVAYVTPSYAVDFCVDIPATQVDRVKTAVCDHIGWSATLPTGQANAELCVDAAKRWVRDQMRSAVLAQEAGAAEKAARDTVDADLRSVVVPIIATPTPAGGEWTPIPFP